ncbi:hypothetical protein [Nocardia sp. NRRL S-836]|uniref:hypothetical protein n=1 Tax=Nocardia sp. NRRL S-836 TaxID=1519492 RepID=UPI0012FC3787|nr:hypothetical protein [Nocardia sp. NRRL S-836]
MKQADLLVGNEYAYPTYKPYDDAPVAARVRVVSVDGRGKVTVQVVDPGAKPPKNAWGARLVKRNEQQQVATRDIACPWEEWAERAASIGAELKTRVAKQRSWFDELEQSRADRVIVDAGRVLPEEYDDEFTRADTEERGTLTTAYIKARGLGEFVTLDELRPLLVDLPVPVLRDILASDTRRQSGTPGTVASVFIRSAELLEVARIASMDRHRNAGTEIPQPGDLLGEHEVAFVNTILEGITASGGELLLPPVPTLPDWVDEDMRTIASLFGWLRVAVADTSGEMLHSPGCTVVRSRPVLLVDHVPWWLVMLESPRRLCSKCDGPAVRDLVPMAGFVAAVDVWHARGCDRIEQWQQAAFQRLIAATMTARTQALEPDITLAWRITATLAEDPPGHDGWAAYALMTVTAWNRLDEAIDRLTPVQQEAARVLARERLTTLEAALPSSQRLLPLPRAVDIQVLRERYRDLKRRHENTVPQLDRLLFTLPGADS